MQTSGHFSSGLKSSFSPSDPKCAEGLAKTPILPRVQHEFLSVIFSYQFTAGKHQEKEQPQDNWVGAGFQPRVKSVGMDPLAGLWAFCSQR